MLTTFVIAVLSAVASIIQIPVLDSYFRVTMGVVVMIVLMRALGRKNFLEQAFWSGLFVCLVRMAVLSFQAVELGPKNIASILLEVFFYIGYGLIARYTIVDRDNRYPIPYVVSLVLADFGGNSLEYFMRYLFAEEIWHDAKLLTLILAAVARSVIIISLIWVVRKLGLNKEQMKEGAHA